MRIDNALLHMKGHHLHKQSCGLHEDLPCYASKLRPKLYKFMIDAGVLLRPLGNVVYILPPYVISPTELNFIRDRIVESLSLC